MRSCETCTECCRWLIGNSYGHTFGCGKSCAFKTKSGCSIYNIRPDTCQNYKCAWLQGLFPEWMKPNICNVLISVEDWKGFKYIKALEINDQVITQEVKHEILKFCSLNNCYCMIQENGKWIFYGSLEFIQDKSALVKT
jgi:hypothetical protein